MKKSTKKRTPLHKIKFRVPKRVVDKLKYVADLTNIPFRDVYTVLLVYDALFERKSK